jgi:hypothetical protein
VNLLEWKVNGRKDRHDNPGSVPFQRHSVKTIVHLAARESRRLMTAIRSVSCSTRATREEYRTVTGVAPLRRGVLASMTGIDKAGHEARQRPQVPRSGRTHLQMMPTPHARPGWHGGGWARPATYVREHLVHAACGRWVAANQVWCFGNAPMKPGALRVRTRRRDCVTAHAPNAVPIPGQAVASPRQSPPHIRLAQ